MKANTNIFPATLCAVALALTASFSFYACQKDPAGTPDQSPKTEFFQNGKFKKILTASDGSGKNKVVFEVSANNEALLAGFDATSFEALPYESLPEDVPAAAVGTPVDNHETAPETEPEAESDENRYAVKILSTVTEPGMKGIELRFATPETGADDRACPQSFGYYTNGTSSLGAVNYSPYCTRVVLCQFFRFSQGIAVPFQGANVWYNLYSAKPGSSCYVNGPCCPLTMTSNSSKLIRELGSNNAGVQAPVRYTFQSTNGNTVGMKIFNGACQGNAFGIFIFV